MSFLDEIKKHITLVDGEIIFDGNAINAAVDRERNNASTTASENTKKKLRSELEADIRSQLEEEAKLTAEEKFAKEREQWQKDIEKREKEFSDKINAFNNERVMNHYKQSGLFSDEELETFSGFVTNNYEESLANANKLIDARKKRNDAYEKEFKQKYLMDAPRNNGVDGGEGQMSDAARRAQEYSKSNTSDVVDLS